ncbi:hypothetical protein B0O99DRAFT_743675 [Bisporella sp. PMI_857]|nr:hypothetical protein B0O99DRAFT_743675 [Bisporella sp. PMI_857]
MSTSYQSRGSKGLHSDIMLIVVEHALRDDPKAIKKLLSLSKDTNSLLNAYERSIVKNVIVGGNFHYQVLPSRRWPAREIVKPCSYHWLSELHSRPSIVKYLVQHPISNCSPPYRTHVRIGDAQFGIFSDAARLQKTLMLKNAGLQLLYEIADCTAGLRAGRQLEFLMELDTVELAVLGTLVNILSNGYADLVQPLSGVAEGRKIERACVFEDKLLRYGPFFASAAVGGLNTTELDHQWVNEVIERGLIDLKDFETGASNKLEPSMQSKLWSIFCQKAGCSNIDRWLVASELIDDIWKDPA